MLSSSYAQVSLGVHVVVLGMALVRGGRHVRVGALIIAGAATAAVVLQDQDFRGADRNLLGVELLQFLALTCLALVSRRNWTTILAGLSLLTIMLHLGKMIDDGVATFPYLSLVLMTGYASLATILLATIRPEDLHRAE